MGIVTHFFPSFRPARLELDGRIRNVPRARTPALDESFPADFGIPYGSGIVNKTEAASIVDRAVGTGRPPDLELLMRDAILGHIAIRYRNPGTGKMECVNIRMPMPGDIEAGREPLVHFTRFDELLWGLREEAHAHGYLWGQYNGDYMGVRLESLDDARLSLLHAALNRMDARSREGLAKFDLRGSVVRNRLNALRPKRGSRVEYGNCSLWVGNALVEAGILHKPSMFPRRLFSGLYREHGGKDSDNVHVVHYARMTHAHGDMAYIPTRGITNPMDVRHWREFWNLARLADVVAEVPVGTQRLVARRRDAGPDAFTGAAEAHPAR